MYRTALIAATLIALLLVSAIWVGCSNDTIEIVNTGTVTQYSQSGVTEYFPLTEGFSSIFEVENSYGSEIVTYTVGGEVTFSGVTSIEWISYSPRQGYDTGYFRATNTALYYYERLNSSPEKIIELPLRTGQTWMRLSNNSADPIDDDDVDDETSLIFGKDDVPDTSVIVVDGGAVAKNFPISGEVSMSVQGVEVLYLSDGTALSGSVKITSQNSQGTWNQYWFAPGIGLVKYVVGGASITSDAGSESGELRSYGTKR